MIINKIKFYDGLLVCVSPNDIKHEKYFYHIELIQFAFLC